MVRVSPGGRGDANDAAMVAAELEHMPAHLISALDARGVALIACRDSVVDYAPRLANDHPREWPAGRTWRDVPGAYLPDEHAVVVATMVVGGRRIVPAFGTGHGSASLPIHEALHAVDYTAPTKPSRDPRFRSAWARDYALLGVDYFRDAESGPEESYAESGARTYGSWSRLRDQWPTLRDYWINPGAIAAEPHLQREQQVAPAEPSPLGFGRFSSDGKVQLFLTARGERGEHGHGMIEIDSRQIAGESLSTFRAQSTGDFDFFDIRSLDELGLSPE